MKKYIPLLVFMNSALIGLPSTFIGAWLIGCHYTVIAGIVFFVVGLNTCILGISWGIDNRAVEE